MRIGPERPMTMEELALLREVVRHLRAGGAKYVPALARVQLGDGRSFAWETHGALHWPAKGEVGVAPYWRRPTNWHEVGSITEAVDVLVSLGYLPKRFSSAYFAGWHAATEWHTGTGDGAEFKRLFHDPGNISFPAREPSW